MTRRSTPVRHAGLAGNPSAASRYLCGDQVTEADWRLFTTLVRFDPVYHTHFKCKLAANIPTYGAGRARYQWPGVAGTVHFDHIVRHYHYSHATINPYRIIPINPVIDLGRAPRPRPHLKRPAGRAAHTTTSP